MTDTSAQSRDPQAPYTVAEAAAKLRVSVWTIYRMVRDGELRAHRFRGIVRIPAREVDSRID